MIWRRVERQVSPNLILSSPTWKTSAARPVRNTSDADEADLMSAKRPDGDLIVAKDAKSLLVRMRFSHRRRRSQRR